MSIKVLCAGVCGRMLSGGGTGSLPAGQRTCRSCRGAARGGEPCDQPFGYFVNAGKTCNNPAGCTKSARKRGMCSTCYNKATGNFVGDIAKDPDRERARLRTKTYWRKSRTRDSDITPEYDVALRAKAKRCPLCQVKLTDVPYLPHSKELDHLVPLNIGGTHTIGNVRILCRTCNMARPKDGSDYVGPVTLWAQAG